MLHPALQDVMRELGIEVPSCRRILVVDDEPENLDVLCALLEPSWDVVTASSGPEALQRLLCEGPADLVIADQRMPEMLGIDLLERIAEQWPQTVRIVLTAYSDVEPMLDAINRGSAYRFLLKPYNADELRAVAQEALRLKSTSTTMMRLLQGLSEHRGKLDQTLQQLQNSQQQVVASERLATLGRTTSGVVHDLRNAAAILQILVDLVRQQTSAPAVLRHAETAWSSLGSLLELLEQLRDFAQSNSAAARPEPTTMYDFLASTVRLFYLELPSGLGREIELDVGTEVSSLAIDRGRIRQALMALLRNANRASEPGLPIKVTVRSLEAGTQACIEVSDLGHGMDPDTLRRAREPFFSGFDPPGLGLGLEIVRLAAAAHGGELAMESALGRGTRARLIVPTLAFGSLGPAGEAR